jgi:hypothetical protein
MQETSDDFPNDASIALGLLTIAPEASARATMQDEAIAALQKAGAKIERDDQARRARDRCQSGRHAGR